MALTRHQKLNIALGAALSTIFGLSAAAAYLYEKNEDRKLFDRLGPDLIANTAFTNGRDETGCKYPQPSFETVRFDISRGSLSGSYYEKLADRSAVNSACLTVCFKSDTAIAPDDDRLKEHYGAIVSFSLEKDGELLKQTIYGTSCTGLKP